MAEVLEIKLVKSRPKKVVAIAMNPKDGCFLGMVVANL
jgi:hypothetical protein